jgi:hypothetical protein
MPNPIFVVIVSHVGSVYAGNNYLQASSKYTAYVKLSREATGRAAGETVTLFHNGEVRREHLGKQEEDNA